MEKRSRIISTMGVADKISEIPIESELSLEEQLEEGKNKEEKLLAENKELLTKIEELKRQLKDRDELFRIIAHDTRGPIGMTDEFIKVLLEEIDSMSKEEIASHLNLIHKNSEAAFKLLENLLTWSHLQQNGIKAEIMVMNLSNQVKDAIAPLLLMAEKKNINLKNEISDGINILADSNMLQTTIRNLSSNAIKFTESDGNISISCEKTDNEVKIYVIDDGKGIPKGRQDKILNGLIGHTTLGTNGEKGTGTGLRVCKEMVEMMGGHIDFKSEEEKGTTFTITLPAGSQ